MTVIEPLTPGIGAEIHGVDLSQPLDDETFRCVHDAWMKHLVLFFRDQALDIEGLDRLRRRFGEAHVHPSAGRIADFPGVIRIHTDADSKVYAGRMWHSDVSNDAEPPMGSILHLHVVPDSGGDTLFANMYAAFEALSDPLKSWLLGLTAVHSSVRNDRDYFKVDEKNLRDGVYPESEHPVARTHPVTGRRALFVNQAFTTHIVQLEPAESDAVLGFLYRHIDSPRFHCRFRWRRNSVAFWDNRCAQHLAMWDYHPQTRSGYRATLAGDRPV